MKSKRESILKQKEEAELKVQQYQHKIQLLESGKEFSYKIISDEEYVKALKDKLIEEAIEVSKANRSNIMEELADVLEVIEAFKVLYSIDPFQLECERQEKAMEKGGFNRKCFLEYVIEEDE